jgi:hypothetical protein
MSDCPVTGGSLQSVTIRGFAAKAPTSHSRGEPLTDPAVPTPAYAAPTVVPGKTLGIVGLIVDFFIPVLGLILSIVAKVQSNRVGAKNTPATVGIVLGIVFIVVYVIIVIVVVALTAAACTSGAATCTTTS